MTRDVELVTVQLTVNGNPIEASIPPVLNLMHFLRDELRLTGAKNGCDSGHCGSCTVVVNGEARRACLLRMGKLDGAGIETIESLAQDGSLHPLQKAFIEMGAVQCGYCTPGVLMSAKALLDRNPQPSRAEIKAALDLNRNTCRCTGYVKVFEAIEGAAARLRAGGTYSAASESEEGRILLLHDALDRVRGRTEYADDLKPEGLLYGKLLWSDHPHAQVLFLDATRAEAMDGVRAVITASDIPGENLKGIVIKDEPAIARDKVRYIGDSLAAVFADSAAIAEEAVRSIQVDYRPLPGVFSPEQASAPGAPKVHEAGNLLHHARIQRGDVEAAFSQCAAIVEGTFTTPFVEHGFLETESGLAMPNDDGGVTILYPTQSAFDDQAQLAAILDLPKEKIRVIQTPSGGAFGGKEDMLFHQYLALAALRTGRPVKITLTRPESLRVHAKRHPAVLRYKTGAAPDGHLLAIQSRVTLDTGAYASLGADVLENTLVFGAGPYFVPNLDLEGWAWYSNNVPAGAMRGFGVNQVAVALEQQLDELARILELDPIELRLRNALDVGLPTAADHVLEPGVPAIKETLLATRQALSSVDLPAANGRKIGIGIASAVKNIGFGHGLPESAGVIIELMADGQVSLHASQHEYGQGAHSALAMMVAEELGTPLEHIRVFGPDTAVTPETGPTTASRQTFLTGNATLLACRALKEELFSHAAETLDVAPERLELLFDRILDPKTGRHLPLSDFGDRFVVERRYHAPTSAPLLEGEISHFGQADFVSRPTHWCYAYNTQAAIVAVDPKDGSVDVLRIISANDVGHVINRQAIEGQIHGGVMMGLGYALSERFLVEDGIHTTDSLHKIRLPSAGDTPEIDCLLVEVPHPLGPGGVKGFAEAPSLATAPAILNAVHDAVGVRVRDLPADRGRMKYLLDANGEVL
jgi:CO/xanthine dehydrogenase Mo-binding subunit/aerobic-type carbon monoxide dehydrogenase small subunit (CoxS/CutS family)